MSTSSTSNKYTRVVAAVTTNNIHICSTTTLQYPALIGFYYCKIEPRVATGSCGRQECTCSSLHISPGLWKEADGSPNLHRKVLWDLEVNGKICNGIVAVYRGKQMGAYRAHRLLQPRQQQCEQRSFWCWWKVGRLIPCQNSPEWPDQLVLPLF